jgi:sulfur-oxidizing protein SoxZ
MANARIQLPRQARRGEVIEVRFAVAHPMETGYRRTDSGGVVPKNVINRLTCKYNGVEVFRAQMGTGISANPYLQFHTVADRSGEFLFEWVDDDGVAGSESARLVVTGQ